MISIRRIGYAPVTIVRQPVMGTAVIHRMVKYADGKWYQHGVTDYVYLDPNGEPKVFAKVSYFYDFIKETTGKELCH